MWTLIIPLILGDASAPPDRIEHRIEFATQAGCAAHRAYLRAREENNAPATYSRDMVDTDATDQPLGVDARWTYERAEIGYCARGSSVPLER
jgi:hypothetical protein